MPDYVIYKYGPINCSIESYQGDLFTNFIIAGIYRGVPIFLALVISIVGYIKIMRKLKEIPRTSMEESEFQVSRLLWYPVGLIVIFVPTLIEPIVKLFIEELPTWFMAIRLGVPHSIGFINAIMYIILRKLYFKVNNNYQVAIEYEKDSFSLDASLISHMSETYQRY